MTMKPTSKFSKRNKTVFMKTINDDPVEQLAFKLFYNRHNRDEWWDVGPNCRRKLRQEAREMVENGMEASDI